MSKLAVIVTTPPHSNSTVTAISFVEAAIDMGIEVVGVFFYQSGVLNASEHLSIPTDEFQITKQWQQLRINHSVPLHLCISAAQKRGLDDEVEHQLADELIQYSNLNNTFTISGLGELVELTYKADRMVQF